MTAPVVGVVTATTARRGRLLGLDGVRGFFMALFMAYHFGFHAITGAWIGMNLFFILSAYLIVSLLLRERERRGRIDVLAFYRRRARRLLPALSTVLIFIAAYSWIFQSAAARRQTGGDILATTGFVLNWRLIRRADDYFGDLEAPSMLRHLWTLSVEEQFYLVVPLLLAILLALRSRRRALALCLLIVVVSAWRTVLIGVETLQDQAHAYYGTDTRVQAFALGVALAVYAPLGQELPKGLTERRVRKIGLVGLVVTSLGFLVIEPMSVFMFEQGGMVIFNLAATALVLGVAQRGAPGPAQWFSHPTFVWLGVRSYALYLWHWPVMLILQWNFPSLGMWVRFFLAFALTLGLAAASYRWLERPVIEGGLRALHPRVRSGRLVAATAFAFILVSATALYRSPEPELVAAHANVPPLVQSDGEYVPGETTVRVGVLGDSVAQALFDHFPQTRYSDIEPRDLAVSGCDFSGWTPAGFNAGPLAPDPECEALKDNLDTRVRDADLDVVLMLGLQAAVLPHFDDDGRFVRSSDPEHVKRLEAALDDMHRQAILGGAREFVVATVPCRAGLYTKEWELPPVTVDFMAEHPEEARTFADPEHLNTWLRAWAEERDIPVWDLYDALGCNEGFKPTLQGVTLFEDPLHFTPEANAMIWSWLAPRSRSAIGLSDGLTHESPAGGDQSR